MSLGISGLATCVYGGGWGVDLMLEAPGYARVKCYEIVDPQANRTTLMCHKDKEAMLTLGDGLL